MENMNQWAELKKKHSYSYKVIEHITGIPARTYQSWVHGVRKAPEWLYPLVAFYLDQPHDIIGDEEEDEEDGIEEPQEDKIPNTYQLRFGEATPPKEQRPFGTGLIQYIP